MKSRIFIIAFLLCVLPLAAQEQAGIVKTIGRPGQPGKPIEDVTVRAKGSSAVSISDRSGNFMLTLTHYTTGQAYSLSRVQKAGYQLADTEVIGRSYPFSEDIPLEISMIPYEDYYRTKSEIEAQVRSRMEKEYHDKLEALNKQLEEKLISEELLQKEHLVLLDYYDNIENLVEELSDRYARTDYDRLDSLDRKINLMIEQGRLEEAEALIESKQTKQELEQIKASNATLAQALEEGKRAEARKTEEYARELQKRYEIAAMRFDNPAAAGFLKERIELDPSNIEWKIKYATFIRDYLGHYDEAMVIYQELLATVTDTYIIAEIYGCIGSTYYARGEYDKSLQAYEKTAVLREENANLHYLGISYTNIASCHIAKDNFTLGLEYLDKAQVLYEEQQDSLGIAHIYSTRGLAQRELGYFKESIENILTGLGIFMRNMGENTLDVASSYANLAAIMKGQGRFPEAFDYLHNAIRIRKMILGDKHPDVAKLYLSLGSLETENGNNENALGYYENALDLLMVFHSGKHPDITRAYNLLGNYHKNISNDMEKALYYHMATYESARGIFGDIHSTTAEALYNLGTLYHNMAQNEKAIEYYEKAHDIWLKIYGEGHFTEAHFQNGMAIALYTLGRKEEAFIYFEKALQTTINYYGEIHPQTGKAYHNLASKYTERKEYGKALELLGKACKIYQAVFDPEHSTLGNVHNQMGIIYLHIKDYDKAERSFNEALKIYTTAYGEEHADVALIYVNQSFVHQKRGELSTAAEKLEKGYHIFYKIYGKEHTKVVSSLANLSELYAIMGNYDKAIEYMHTALEIAEKLYPKGNEIILAYKSGLADTYFKIGAYGKAMIYNISAFYDSMEKSGLDKGFTGIFFKELIKTYTKLIYTSSYNGEFAEELAHLNVNTMITATVAKESQAEQMGLNGTYQVVKFEDWISSDTQIDFFRYNMSVADRGQKTYILHRNGEFIKVTFEGIAGIYLNATLISSEEKQAILKEFKQWYRKNK